MDTALSALDVLTDALERCRDEDMRTPQVTAALDFLAARADRQWPFEQFRKALVDDNEEGRWQNLNASLNAPADQGTIPPQPRTLHRNENALPCGQGPCRDRAPIGKFSSRFSCRAAKNSCWNKDHIISSQLRALIVCLKANKRNFLW